MSVMSKTDQVYNYISGLLESFILLVMKDKEHSVKTAEIELEDYLHEEVQELSESFLQDVLNFVKHSMKNFDEGYLKEFKHGLARYAMRDDYVDRMVEYTVVAGLFVRLIQDYKNYLSEKLGDFEAFVDTWTYKCYEFQNEDLEMQDFLYQEFEKMDSQECAKMLEKVYFPSRKAEEYAADMMDRLNEECFRYQQIPQIALAGAVYGCIWHEIGG